MSLKRRSDEHTHHIVMLEAYSRGILNSPVRRIPGVPAGFQPTCAPHSSGRAVARMRWTTEF